MFLSVQKTVCSFLKNFKATQENNFVKDEGTEIIDKDSAHEIFNTYNVSSGELIY